MATDLIKFITCPACQGAGCAKCQGIGVGAFFHDRFYYFDYPVNKTTQILDRWRLAVDKFLDLTSYAIAIVGWLCLVWWFYQQTDNAGLNSFWSFISAKSWLLIIFWLSALVDLYIIYRLSQKRAELTKIPLPRYYNQHPVLPNTWNELNQIKNKVNVLFGGNAALRSVLNSGYLLAGNWRHGQILPVHLFASCFSQSGEVASLALRLNLDHLAMANKLANLLQKQTLNQTSKTELSFDTLTKEIIIRAYLEAYRRGRPQFSPADLLLPCYEADKNIQEILYDLEVEKDDLQNVVEWWRINDLLIINYRLYKKAARFKPGTNMDRAYTAMATPFLNRLSYDLTLAAKYGHLPLCVGREQELSQILDAWERGARGVLLVGPEGVGKDTLAGGLAQSMVLEAVPKVISDKRLLEVDLAQLIGGATPAAAQERLLIILDEVARAGNILLYIKDVENLAGISSGSQESLDLSEILASALERRNLYCLASVSDTNYRRYVEKLALAKAMTKITVAEPEANACIQMLESKIVYLESRFKVWYSYEALQAAVSLASRYLREACLPLKAEKLLEEVGAEVQKRRGDQQVVSSEDVARLVSFKTRIPVTKVSGDEGAALLHLEDKIHQRMVNQSEAVKAVAAALRRARAELRSGKRPIANFLFLGPTGVGKTELAKTVAAVYFGREDCLVRLDMSEYQHPDSVVKMIGEPNGALGYLTEAVRTQPFSLVLLDEVEKAHPDILNLFLQVFDDGRLTDGQGRTIDFTNTIIIATSNIGALYIQEQIRKSAQGGSVSGGDLQKIKQTILGQHLTKVMRPELINRFDGIIIFQPLTEDNVLAITKLMLKNFGNLLLAKGINLEIDEQGAKFLAQQGYQPEFGARPLRRLLQEKVEDAVANLLLSGKLRRRDTAKLNAQSEIEVIKAKEL